MHVHQQRLTLAAAGLLALSLLTVAVRPAQAARPVAAVAAPRFTAATSSASSATMKPDVVAYRGLGTWIDIYDELPYRRPRLVVADIASRGVKTIYLETANYHRPADPRRKIWAPAVVATIIEAAHRRGMRVVAWYLPSFVDLDHDFARARAAIAFRTPNGERFDSFALDIESDKVRSLETRNRRMAALSQRLSDSLPPNYPIAAILPEAGAKYWPNFPYEVVARHYDAFLPMAYYTFRTSGYINVRRWLGNNVREIRLKTGNPAAPIHLIGGISEDASAREVEALVDEANYRRVIGAGMYSWDGATDAHWRKLTRLTSEP